MDGEPPHDLIAEQSTLGGMLLSAEAATQVTAILTAADFYRPIHGMIFSAIVDLINAGEPVDPLTVGAALEKRGEFKKVGGGPYLLTLLEATPTAANSGYYAKIVAAKARLRGLGELGVRLQQLAYTESSGLDDIDGLIGQGEKFFRQLHQPSAAALDFDALVQTWRQDQESAEGAIRTPWDTVNIWLNGGLRRGKVYVIAGRPGDGKSNAGLNMSAFAAEWDYPALIFSMEMGAAEVASRLLSAGGKAGFGQLVRRQLDLENCAAVDNYVKKVAGMPLEVIDQERITVEQIISHCRSRKKAGVVFIDYLQLIEPTNHRDNENQQLAHISRCLKVAARELNVAMIVAAQLNRGPTAGGGKDGKARAPVVSDIRGSGQIEQDADVVILLHRDESEDGIVKFIVGKNRNGRKGTIELPFYGRYARIG